jgi:hypothetical protein
MLRLAADRARGQLRNDPRRQQQLETEREAVAGARVRRIGTQQRQLIGEQREHLRVRVAGLEQARDRVAGARGGIERGGMVTQPGVGGDRVDGGDGHQLAAALMEHRTNLKARLEPRPEPAASPTGALGDRAQAAVIRRVQMQDPIGLAVTDRT